MSIYHRLTSLCIIAVSAFYSVASGSFVPSANIAVISKTEEFAHPDRNQDIFNSLEKEMRLKGFMGRIRVIDGEDQVAVSGETVVKITITKNRWFTRKLLSIPYLLNRYRKEYIIESFVEIPEGKNGMSVKRIIAVSSTPAVAQYVNNDKYDPALFPNQTEELEMKENTRRMLAKKLANHLFDQLR
jgi:hypothetical protein